MVSLSVVVQDVLVDEASEMAFTERNHAVETLLFDRPDEPFGIGVEIGTPCRQSDRPDTATAEDFFEDAGMHASPIHF